MLVLMLAGGSRAAAAEPAPSSEPHDAPPACATIECGRLIGEVRIAGQRVPLPDAIVVVSPAPDGAQPGPYSARSDEPEPPWARSQRSGPDGEFRFDDLPAGLVRVAALVSGYERRDLIVELAPDATVRAPVFVTPQSGSAYRTVVSSPPIERSRVTEQRLTAEEIATLPGSQGDPLRALQNLPGVARPPLGLGLLVIRGAPPSQSQVFLGGHALPRAFHILSLASVFPADILDELRYVPGNFDAAYGNATGGIVVIEPRRCWR